MSADYCCRIRKRQARLVAQRSRLRTPSRKHGGRQGPPEAAEGSCAAQGSARGHPEARGGRSAGGDPSGRLLVGLSLPEGLPGRLRGGQTPVLGCPGRGRGHLHGHIRRPELPGAQHREDRERLLQLPQKGAQLIRVGGRGHPL